jgi:hypothetical protein
MSCSVLYNELCVPVKTTGGIWTVACGTTNSAYHSIPSVVLTGTQSSVYCTLVHIPPVVLTMVRIVRCTARYSSYSTSCSDWYAEFDCNVLYNELCVPVRTTAGIWTVQYCTPRCTVLYSSYFTSCSEWYAEFVVLNSTVHIPPVVLTGTQSYRTLRTSQNNWWNMSCYVQYIELCVPVRATGGIWTVEYCTTSSVYSTLQFIFHQLFWLVRRVRCAARYSSYSTSCSDWYAEFGVQYSTVHISPVVLQLVEYEL